MSCIWVTAALVPQARASPHLPVGSGLLLPIYEAALPFIQPRWAMSPE